MLCSCDINLFIGTIFNFISIFILLTCLYVNYESNIKGFSKNSIAYKNIHQLHCRIYYMYAIVHIIIQIFLIINQLLCQNNYCN